MVEDYMYRSDDEFLSNGLIMRHAIEQSGQR